LRFKVKVIGNENVEILFSAHLRQTWIDLRQTKTKWSKTHSTHVFEYISPAKMIRFHPRDAMLARVIAITTCLSVCPSVCHAPVLCQNEES